MLTPLLPIESVRLQETAQLLLDYWNVAEGFRLAAERQAPPSSPIGRAGQTKRLYWHPDAAALRLLSGLDHVTTLANVIGSGFFPHQSAFTLLRGALEADAVAAWLLTTESARERRLRRVIDRGYQAFRRLELTGKSTDRRSASIARQVRSLVPSARKAKSTKDVLRIAKSSRPGMTKLVVDLLSTNSAVTSRPVGQLLYNLLSGFAHGEVWATALGTASESRLTPLSSTAAVSADVQRFVICASWLIPAHEFVMARWIELAGGSQADWDATRSRIQGLPSLG